MSIECANLGSEEFKHILKDINLTVKCGQMLAILGGSGSGKTTLLDVIANRHESGYVEGEVCGGTYVGCSRITLGNSNILGTSREIRDLIFIPLQKLIMVNPVRCKTVIEKLKKCTLRI